jgi:hypothetical protein
MTDDAAVKESRRVLRLVQEHLSNAHQLVGAHQESVGLVEIVYHPLLRLGHLNYVTPRKNTAWIPAPELEKGLDRLRQLGRLPRVNFIEGLYPPLFARTLRELGLNVEQETPIMARRLQNGTANGHRSLPDGVTITRATDQEGIALWWYVWRNAHFDVLTRGIEPIYIGRDMQAIASGQQVDILLYRYSFPVGVARVTFHEQTAHLTTLAMMSEARQPDLVRALHDAAVEAAAEHGCDLVFTSGETESDRRLCRQSGFVDSGSMLCYAEGNIRPPEIADDDSLAQPLFAL